MCPSISRSVPCFPKLSKYLILRSQNSVKPLVTSYGLVREIVSVGVVTAEVDVLSIYKENSAICVWPLPYTDDLVGVVWVELTNEHRMHSLCIINV